MKKRNLNYRNLTAFAVLLALAVIFRVSAFRTSNAASSPVASVAISADLAGEERVIAKFADDLAAYDKECAELSKRATLEHIHINPLQVKSDDLKNRLPGVQDAIREVVRKLKAADEWDNLDTRIASAKDWGGAARSREFFQQSSFKQFLEDASVNLVSQKNEIGIPLDNLRKRLSRRTLSPYESSVAIVPAVYHPPTPTMFALNLRCKLATLRVGITRGRDGRPSDRANSAYNCQCLDFDCGGATE